jgi:hypothetical protein
MWVRGQGEAIAKAFWYHRRETTASMISINWTGMTADEKEENRIWCEDFIEKTNKLKEKREEPSTDRNDLAQMEKPLGKAIEKQRKECRGGCGVNDAKKFCSRCKEVCKSPPFNSQIKCESLTCSPS